jgi:hypothetical protein
METAIRIVPIEFPEVYPTEVKLVALRCIVAPSRRVGFAIERLEVSIALAAEPFNCRVTGTLPP